MCVNMLMYSQHKKKHIQMLFTLLTSPILDVVVMKHMLMLALMDAQTYISTPRWPCEQIPI